MERLNKDVAFVGIGGCGTNIAFAFEKLGYTAIHINSSTQDEKSIKGAKSIRHLKGFQGCAGNRKLAEEALAKNINLVDEIIELKENIIFICFSTSGGTGSGVAPALVDMLAEETDKTICCIAVLPDSTEDCDYHKNAYGCSRELMELKDNIGCTIFLDNNKNKKTTINTIATNVISAFINNNASSEFGNVDEQERRTMLATPGSMIITTLTNDRVATEKAIEQIGTNNIYAPIQKDGVCEYIAIINSGNMKQKIDKQEIINLVGVPKRTYEGYNSDLTIIAIAGLSFPIEHIKSLADNAKAKIAERQNSRKETTMTLDDINFDDVVAATEEQPKPQKKMSRRDMLKKLGD